MKKIYFLLCLAFFSTAASAQLFWNTNGITNTLTATNWGTIAAGPFTTAWTNGSNINFTANSLITNITNTPVGNFTVTNASTVTWTAAGTYNTGSGIRTFDIGAGSTLTWNGQNISTLAGTGCIKSGGGTWNIGAQGNLYPAGFTMNAGTIILGGNNAIGNGPLVINGGIIAPNNTNTRTPPVSSITVGGDFQFGDIVNVAAGTGNLTFANAVSLGAATSRKITIGNTGTYSLNGIVSGAGSSLTVDSIATANGTVSLGGVNTYNGGTTLAGGTLQLTAAGALPTTGNVTFNGGALKTGSAAGFTQTTSGTVSLTENSTLRFGTGAHSITFANSSAVGWTAGKMLTITGWAGGYNGTGGTAGKIFVGTDATGLTVGQLAQVQFFNGTSNFPASILSTGEVVAGVAGGTPDILLSSLNPAVAAGSPLQGSNNNVIYRFDLAVTTATATLTGVTITTAGTYAATDITNFKCWYSADAVFNSASDQLLSTNGTPAVAGAQVFPAFINQVIASGSTGYIFITANIPCAAALTNINVTAIPIGDLSFSGTNNVTGSAFDGGLQTITAATPNDVTVPAASVANASSSLSWTTPTGCYDAILIVARATTANDGTPTGDGSAYTGNLAFGSGTALGSGFVVWNGASTSPQVVTVLTNGTQYFYKFFTRKGTSWSAGVEVNATPAQVTSATDFFRTVATGSWVTLATWESSSDSSSWIPSTLIPANTASHVVIQSPDSVWLDASRTTANLTIKSGAKMNALTFTMTASNRFNLLGTAAYYQGGTVNAVPGVEQVLNSTSNYHYNGTQAGISATLPEFGNLFWEPTASGSGTLQNNNAAAPFNNGLVVRGSMTINIQGGTAREVRFATASTTSRTHTIDGNLNITNANSLVVVNAGSSPVAGTLTIGGDLNITAGTLQGLSTTAGNDGTSIINLTGNLSNTGGTIQPGASTAGVWTFNFSGAGSVTADAGTTNSFHAVSVAAGKTVTLTNHGMNVVSGKTVTLAATGNIILGNNDLSINGTVTGGSTTSYIHTNGTGVLKLNVTALKTFPIGNSTYNPVTINNVTGYDWSVKVDDALSVIDPIYIANVDRSVQRTWTITPSTNPPATPADVTFQYDDADATQIGALFNPLLDVLLWHTNSSLWQSTGGPQTPTGTPPGVRTAALLAWSNFSKFAISNDGFLLPITLNYLNGTKQNNNHLLNWKVTCNSSPSVTMDLLRSTDGRNFSSIYVINATALQCQQPFNYTDIHPAPGVNYYRLKMTDADGKVTYSSIVSLINATAGIELMTIAPNPIVNGNFKLNISTAQKTQMDIVITDMQGRLMQKQTVHTIAGFNTFPMNVANLSTGTYQVYGVSEEGRSKVLRFVIQ